MPYLGSTPTTSSQSLVKQDFSVSATTSYTLSQSVTNANDIALYINNVRQEPTTAYSASGTSLTLTEATAGTDDMYCVYIGRAVGTINPPSGSVGSSQITPEMITGQTALATEPADTDEFIVSDAGVLKRIDYSLIKSTSGLVKLVKTTASNSATIDFTSTYITSSYNRYVLVCRNWAPASDSVPRIRFSEDNLSTFENDTYQSGIFYHGIDSSGSAHQGASTTGYHNLNRTLESNEGGHFIFDFPALNVTGKHKCIVESVMLHSNGYGYGQLNALRVNASRTYNSFQLYMSSGNIASGDFILYGVTE